MERVWNIMIIICSLIFGFLFALDQASLWWGFGVTIGCYILFSLSYLFSKRLCKLDNELKNLRKSKIDYEY